MNNKDKEEYWERSSTFKGWVLTYKGQEIFIPDEVLMELVDWFKYKIARKEQIDAQNPGN